MLDVLSSTLVETVEWNFKAKHGGQKFEFDGFRNLLKNVDDKK